jgi:hypothetical protein
MHTSIDDVCGFGNLGANIDLEPVPQIGMHLAKIQQSRVSGNTFGTTGA